jgi:phospholipid/cholesterol/gamma-HCH transport system substrate-binding protein
MAGLGLFLFAALLLLFAGIFTIGNQNRLFSRTLHLKSEFLTVSGLLTGAEVRIGGLRKGTVDAIQLPAVPTGKVVVTFSLDTATSGLVKQDSIAAIETEGLLGNKYLAISFGGPEAGEVRDWSVIPSAPALDVSDLLKKSSAIMDTTHATIRNVNLTAAELATTAARINSGKGTLGALVNERALYNELTATSSAARATMVQAQAGATGFQENMEALKSNLLFRGFYQDRGYKDAADLTRWELPAAPAAAPVKQFTFPVQDLFAKADGAKLKAGKRLVAVGTWLEQNPFGLVLVRAYSSPKGDQDSNLTLTRAQALVVRNYLADRFELDDTRLRTQGLGEMAGQTAGTNPWLEICVYAPAAVATP